MQLGRLERMNLREQWRGEDTDFTPWLASEENIVLLSEAIGIGLEVVSQEKSVGPFRADIVCRDIDSGNYVLIENQLERTDHLHLGQLITYAAGLDAVTIIWIAAHFRDEHKASIDWLNEITSNRINFFGIEIALYKIGDSLPSPMFKIVSTPNEWRKSVRFPSVLTDLQELQLEYWQGLKNYIEEHGSFLNLRNPRPESWYNIPIGRSFAFIGASVAVRETLRTYLFITGDRSREYYDRLEAMGKEKSYTFISDQLQWRRFENQQQQEILLLKEADFRNKEDWENQFAWFKNHFELLMKFFEPLVRNL